MLTLIERVQNPELLDLSGMESLTVPERIALLFKQGSLGIDKAIAGLKFSIHDVDFRKAEIYLNKNNVNFLKNTDKPITVPAYFDPKLIPWESYQQHVCYGALLASQIGKEAERYYGWLKTVASKGKIPYLFKYNITDFDMLVNNCETFLKEAKKNPSAKSNLGDVYGNFTECFGFINRYNLNIKGLKSRDIEIIAKQFEMIYDIGDIILKRMDANDIRLGEDDIEFVAKSLNDICRALNVTGAMVGLLNELTAVYKAQCDEFTKLK